MTRAPSDAWRQTIGRRVAVTAALLAVWFVVIEGRLVQLQVLQHEAKKQEAEGQQQARVTLPARRGDITDRRGLPLARDVDAPAIQADPSAITNPLATVDALCRALDCTPERRRELTGKLSAETKFTYVERHATSEQARRVADLKQDGITIGFEPKRVYPNGELAAHVLGIVGTGHTALEGIELRRNELLKGQPGAAILQKDAKGVAFNRRVEKEPRPGADLELTLEGNMQTIVERELAAGVVENRAAGGCAVVMDPRTGEILALAGYPTFDPNAFEHSTQDTLRNCATQSTYEPGSIMKIVTASAALERRVVRPDDRIDVSAGQIKVGPKDVISDSHKHGVLTFSGVIANSSNVGTIKVAQNLGPEWLTYYIRLFGFGRPTSRDDFAAESPGTVWDPSALTTGALARVSIGYQISVTPLQMAAAMSSIANGGELMQPRIVRAVITRGRRVETQKTVVRRTVSREVSAQLMRMMEEAVERGTGTYAQIPGYTVAGKTGTAEKLVGRAYSKTQHMASFVGTVPSGKPALTIVVVIDSPAMNGPNGHFGGPVAGPIFKRIAEALLHYTGEPPTINPPRPLIVPRQGESVHRATASGPSHGERVLMAVDRERTRDGLFPDLSGMDGRGVIATLSKLGVQIELHGDGFVVSQKPAPGTPIERGSTVTIRLERVDSNPQQSTGRISR